MNDRLIEISLKRNAQWINAALDQRDRRSFILACQERAHLHRMLARCASTETEGALHG